jgi:glycosyltransferase involved in cell wall biosynthesis
MNILLIDNGQEFNINTPYEKPIGGSETSILLLAKGLQDLNNQVTLLCNTQQYYEDTNLVIRDVKNSKITNDYIKQTDIVILNRVDPSYFFQFNKPVYYYSHDNYDQQHTHWMSNSALINKIVRILCVSEYQKQTFNQYFNVPLNKMFVLGNSIDSNLYTGYVKRNINKLIFASIPYKGIEVLNDIFNTICTKTQRDDIELHLFSSMSLYNELNDDKEYINEFNILNNNNGIKLHNVISMKELSRELLSSSVILFPNTYPETFSMLCTQAQASGCIPISTNMGAMNERISNTINGYLTNGINIYNKDVYNEFIDLIIKVLSSEDDHYKMRLECEKQSQKYNYINVARQLMKELKNG